MISIDIYLNETSRHADVILPGLSALEQPHMDEALWGFALRGVARWSPPIFEPGDRPAEWEIALRLGAILSGTPAGDVDVDALDDQWFAARAARHGIAGAEVDTGGLRGPDRIADLTVRVSPWGDGYGERPDGLNLEKLKDLPHGIDFGPADTPIDDILRTTSGDVELAHDNILGDLPRLRRRMAEPRPPLLLIGRRHVRSNNSWLHNLPGLMRGRDRSTLLVHPDDAAERGLTTGARATVTTEAGSVEATVEVSDEIRTGVVSLPHGWGHDVKGVRSSVASSNGGPNTNVLMPGHLIDEPSGNAAVNGVPVEVAPA
jgi:anaerobic selenocysteine-containing dehydrogenase